MAKKQEWTVRVICLRGKLRFPADELPGVWVEQLRYMGYCRELAHFEDPERDVLEFYAPKGSDSKVWSEQSAARMRSFGIDAAPAPKWFDDQAQLVDRKLTAQFMERNNRPKIGRGQ